MLLPANIRSWSAWAPGVSSRKEWEEWASGGRTMESSDAVPSLPNIFWKIARQALDKMGL